MLQCSLLSVCLGCFLKYAQSCEIVHEAVGVMLYALFTYHWRAAAIRRGNRQQYDDRIGPVRSMLLPGVDSILISPIDDPLYCLAWYAVPYPAPATSRANRSLNQLQLLPTSCFVSRRIEGILAPWICFEVAFF